MNKIKNVTVMIEDDLNLAFDSAVELFEMDQKGTFQVVYFKKVGMDCFENKALSFKHIFIQGFSHTTSSFPIFPAIKVWAIEGDDLFFLSKKGEKEKGKIHYILSDCVEETFELGDPGYEELSESLNKAMKKQVCED